MIIVRGDELFLAHDLTSEWQPSILKKAVIP